MNIVWDVKKAGANIRNHGIEFSHGATVLNDPMAVTIEDTRHGEQRFVTVGADILGRVLVAVYPVRNNAPLLYSGVVGSISE